MEQVEEERRLLDRVRALDDDNPGDRWVVERGRDRGPDVEQRREREVAGRREAAVDRLDLRDSIESRDLGEDVAARQRRDVAAGDRVVSHADRAAGEDDGDPRPRGARQLRSSDSSFLGRAVASPVVSMRSVGSEPPVIAAPDAGLGRTSSRASRASRPSSPASTSSASSSSSRGRFRSSGRRAATNGSRWPTSARSEEHTSELQSRGHLVCRLLLEKKKKPSSPIQNIYKHKNSTSDK